MVKLVLVVVGSCCGRKVHSIRAAVVRLSRITSLAKKGQLRFARLLKLGWHTRAFEWLHEVRCEYGMSV